MHYSKILTIIGKIRARSSIWKHNDYSLGLKDVVLQLRGSVAAVG